LVAATVFMDNQWLSKGYRDNDPKDDAGDGGD